MPGGAWTSRRSRRFDGRKGTWCSWLSRSLSMREVLGSIPNVSNSFFLVSCCEPRWLFSLSSLLRIFFEICLVNSAGPYLLKEPLAQPAMSLFRLWLDGGVVIQEELTQFEYIVQYLHGTLRSFMFSGPQPMDSDNKHCISALTLRNVIHAYNKVSWRPFIWYRFCRLPSRIILLPEAQHVWEDR